MRLLIGVVACCLLLIAQSRLAVNQIQPPQQEGLLSVALVNGKYEWRVVQPGPTGTYFLYGQQHGTALPTNPCNSTPGGTFYIHSTMGDLYFCKNGTWQKVTL